MSTIAVTNQNFETEVLNATLPVLVDFWAPWCGPCRMLAPVLEEISNERNDLKVVKINVDDEEELAAKFGIMSIPTLILFRDGKPVRQTMGVQPKASILGMLD